MNNAIVSKLALVEGVHIHRPNMQIGCVAHIVNLVAQSVSRDQYGVLNNSSHIRTLGYGLGMAPNPDSEDFYEAVHQFPLVYDPESDPEVIQEMQDMKKDSSSTSMADNITEAMDETSDLEDEDSNSKSSNIELESDANSADEGRSAWKPSQKTWRNFFTVIDKVCW